LARGNDRYAHKMKSPAIQAFVETAISNSFFINRLEDVQLYTALPTYLSYHRILLLESGSGSLTVDDHIFEVKGSELFLMAKGQVYQFHEPFPVSGYLLCFGDCFWERAPASANNCKAVLFNNAAANQNISLTEPGIGELRPLFALLHSEYSRPSYINQLDAIAAFLKIIMIKVANVRLTEETMLDSPDYILYRKFIAQLSTSYKTYREVADYALMLGITARRLTELCKRCTGKNAKDIISGQLIAEAKRSLQFGSSPVKAIAYELSFGSAEQFSHFFKKNTGFSPADYRNKFVNMGANR
jgi:AraC family transcriptional activator of pobA